MLQAYTRNSLMKPGRNIRRLRNERWLKAVAILFLVYTGIDLVSCQVCCENVAGLPTEVALALSAERQMNESLAVISASSSEESQDDQRSSPSTDEDCFCCCTNVMASPVFASSANADLKMNTSLEENIPIPTAPLNNPYHPPRFI